MSTILIVDDDPSVLAAFEQVLTDQGHKARTALRGEVALQMIQDERPDLIVMDIRMPGLNGLEAMRRIRSLDPRLPVIIMTGYATTDTAIEATKQGAFDYHLKPLDPEGVLKSIERALERSRLMKRPVELNVETASAGTDVIVGHSREMLEVYKGIGQVAGTDASVLICGETGTGKELVARAIYQHSARSRSPLIVVNCAAIPETLLESELFGHEKGAFTGADRRRIGKFEQADGGTLFLDEVGDIALPLQAKLLRALQGRTVERVGSNVSIPVDIRVLAATHHDLAKEAGAGQFREDLFHRLNVFAIHIPPLRERCDDIPLLVAYFLRKLSTELGIEFPGISAGALDALKSHSWPGNVRELQHCVQRALLLCRGYPIQPEDIRQALLHASAKRNGTEPVKVDQALTALAADYLAAHAGESAADDFVALAERAIIQEALQLAGGNRSQAARLLGLARPTLKDRIDRHHLGRDGGEEGFNH